MLTLMVVIGFLSGLITGLLSLGGALVMITLLVTLPALFHRGNFTMVEIGQIVTMQSIFSMTAGSIVYLRTRNFHFHTFVFAAIAGFFGGGTGAYLSGGLPNYDLKVIYATLSTLATILLLLSILHRRNQLFAKIGSVTPRTQSTVLFFLVYVVSLLGGTVGITAGFILVPLIQVLNPNRSVKESLGTALLVQAMIALGNLFGRLLIGQDIPLELVTLVIMGGVLGGVVGSILTKRISVRAIRFMSSFAISMLTLRAWFIVFK